mmetsp:Transcript_63166/g.152814  ORF Transcript_63166/g.152814 Transcript_63166/m.152814 type:complete len:333 (-) Transcript_63166:347-1345(-)
MPSKRGKGFVEVHAPFMLRNLHFDEQTSSTLAEREGVAHTWGVLEAKRVVQLEQYVHHVCHGDKPRCAWVVLAPDLLEHLHVAVGECESLTPLIHGHSVIEIVQNDGHQKVEQDEGRQHEERNEVDRREPIDAAVDSFNAVRWPNHAIMHDPVVRFARAHAEQGNHRDEERLEVGIFSQELSPADVGKEVHRHHSVDEVHEQEHRANVDKTREREQQGLEQSQQSLARPHKAEDPRHTHNAQQSRELPEVHDLSHKRANHQEEIKAVPADRQVLTRPKRKDLQCGLNGEDVAEHKVDNPQRVRKILALIRVTAGQYDRVDEDQRHDEQLELP